MEAPMAILWEARLMQLGQLAQASPARAGLPSYPCWELGVALTLPRKHPLEALLQPWQSKALDTIPNTSPAPSSAPGTQH